VAKVISGAYLSRRSDMEYIGRIADGATETSARVILVKGKEKEVLSESLVIVHNGDDPNFRILGVLREGLGKNEFLSYTSYRPEVAYTRHGGQPSGAREVYSFSVRPIGVITDSGIDSNKSIIQPRSPVYLLEERENPMEFLARGIDVLWVDMYMEGHPSWKVPVNRFFIPYHIGVYGSTGSGKSWFARFLLVPLYIKAGFKILILDWSGTDYAPFYAENPNSEVVRITEIAIEEEALMSYFKNKTSKFLDNDHVEGAFDEFVEGWASKVRETRGEREPEKLLYDKLKKHVENAIQRVESRWRGSAERAARRAFRKLKPEDLKPVIGSLTVEELLQKLREKDVVVVDMGGVLGEAKLGFYISLSKYLYELMEAGEDLNLAILIDEAPQYAPWDPKGIQAESSEMTKNLAALGRKRMLSLTLIAQGIRGEIGINAAVRRNLNTHFFGRIHPLDAAGEGGAQEWLSPFGISPNHLLQLRPGLFYFSGAMNPSPTPLLITYDVPRS